MNAETSISSNWLAWGSEWLEVARESQEGLPSKFRRAISVPLR